ncbi:oxidoreductase [Plantactinospora endophytica]|uniref:Oxidoreductase n=1 Tax=Plantactinospora endophytica TaxID=673535 RepID=A0ABQ4EAW4_9ACTN|nr:oxidoreductase [Plantactinospora endophytica]
MWSAFGRGAEVDLRGSTHPVRAEVLAELLTGGGDRAAGSRAALRLRSARIVGRLDLRHAEITVPVSIGGCSFTDVPELTEARAVNLALTDCDLPGLRARLLHLRGDLVLLNCVVTGPVDLRDAHVGGTVTLNGSRLADLAPAGDPVFPPIDPGTALAAGRLSVTGNLHARQGFVADGQVWLGGATVGGNLALDGATLRHPAGAALSADRLTVAGSLTARWGFTADGDVLLMHAQIGSQLNFHNARLQGAAMFALHLGGARVGSVWLTLAERPAGRVRLSGLQADTIFDDPATWPAELDLIGCTYRLLIARAPSPPREPSPPVPVTVRQRLDWLRRSPEGYTPQPYEQLAEHYRRSGQEAEARRVLLERQRRRRATLRVPGRLFGVLVDGLVGYGYRTWLAGIWLLAFWALGTLSFTLDPSAARNPAEAPERNAALQALDLLLPIVNLGHDNAWKPVGGTEYVAALLVLAGWVLSTAVVAGLTRTLNR